MDDLRLLKIARNCRKELRKTQIPTKSLQGCAFISDTGVVVTKIGLPCLGLLTYDAYIPSSLAFWVDFPLTSHWKYNGPNAPEPPNEMWEANERLYIDWLIHRSVWAPVFANTGYADVLKGTILRTHMPTNFTVQASIAVRTLAEFEYVPQLFAHLYRTGIEPHAALFFAHAGRLRDTPDGPVVDNQSTWCGGHSLFQHHDYSYVKAMEEGRIRTDREGPFSEHTSYRDYSFNFEDEGGNNVCCKSFFNRLEGMNTLGIPVWNPFNDQGQTSLEDFIGQTKKLIAKEQENAEARKTAPSIYSGG